MADREPKVRSVVLGKEPRKRCALYLRVSTERQAAGHDGKERDWTERYGLPTQEAECRAYAEKMGWEVLEEHIYKETFSGAYLWERPELTRMREAMSQRAFDVILVHDLDRLSREVHHQGLIFSEAERYGVDWDTVVGDKDDSPQGRFLLVLMGGTAEMERHKIVERTTRGHRGRVASGKMSAAPRPRWGYEWHDPKTKAAVVLDHDPERGNPAATMREVFLAIFGGATVRQVCKGLNNVGKRTPLGGLVWWPSTLQHMLKDPIYMGRKYAYRYGAVRNKDGKRVWRLRPQEEWVLVETDPPVPPIVSEEVWHAVQWTLADNQARSTRANRQPKSALLGGGHVRCAACGSALYVHNGDSRNRPRYVHSPVTKDAHGCPYASILVHHLDPAVWSVIEQVFDREDESEPRVRGHQQDDPTAKPLEAIERELVKVARQHGRATERLLLFEGDEDDPTFEAAQATVGRLADQVRRLREERATLEARRATWVANQRAFLNLKRAMRRVREVRRSDLHPETRQAAVRALDVEVKLFPRNHRPRWEIWMRLSPSATERFLVMREGDAAPVFGSTIVS